MLIQLYIQRTPSPLLMDYQTPMINLSSYLTWKTEVIQFIVTESMTSQYCIHLAKKSSLKLLVVRIFQKRYSFLYISLLFCIMFLICGYNSTQISNTTRQCVLFYEDKPWRCCDCAHTTAINTGVSLSWRFSIETPSPSTKCNINISLFPGCSKSAVTWFSLFKDYMHL